MDKELTCKCGSDYWNLVHDDPINSTMHIACDKCKERRIVKAGANSYSIIKLTPPKEK